ncbi:MAG: SRPBCC family protein [Sandaracinaceae bacterium]
MELKNSFEVGSEPRQSWEFLLTPERVVPCIPGAEFIGVKDDGSWQAKAKVKLGPVNMAYKGKVQIVERDDEAMRVVMKGSGTETRGKGTVKADIISQILPTDGGGTRVEIVSNLVISGRAAQFGRGMISDVAEKFTTEFAQAMEYELASDAERSASSAADEATAAAVTAAAEAAEAAKAAVAEPEPSGDVASRAAVLPEAGDVPKELLDTVQELLRRSEEAARTAERAARQAEAAFKQAEAASMQADAAEKRSSAAIARVTLSSQPPPPERGAVGGVGLAVWALTRAVGRFVRRLFGGGSDKAESRQIGSGS